MRGSILCIAGAALLWACSEPTKPVVPAKLEVMTTAPAAEVGSIIRVQVRVTDAKGVAVRSTAVGWAAGGGGSVDSLVTHTDASGAATVHWTLGTSPVEQTLTSTVTGLTPAVIRVSPRAAPAASVTLAADSVRIFTLSDTVRIAVAVQDRYANPLPASEVTWRSLDERVAAVDAGGLVRGVARGVARVVASAGTVTDTVRVYVIPRGLFTITFDDGWASTYTRAFPALKEFGLRANAAVFPVAIDQRYGGYMRIEHVRELHAAGWAIVSHSMTHPYLTKLTAEQLDHELRESQAWIRSHGFRGSDVFIVPFHDWSTREREAIKKYYKAARGAFVDDYNPPRMVGIPFDDPHKLTAYEPASPSFATPEGRAKLRTYVARAVEHGAFVDILFHQIQESEVAGFRETARMLAEYEPYLRTYAELIP